MVFQKLRVLSLDSFAEFPDDIHKPGELAKIEHCRKVSLEKFDEIGTHSVPLIMSIAGVKLV
jgi:hypothetical protein